MRMALTIEKIVHILQLNSTRTASVDITGIIVLFIS